MEAPPKIVLDIPVAEPVKPVVSTPVAPKPQPTPQPKLEVKKANLVTATYGVKSPITPASKPAELQKVELDLSGVVEGATVIHKTFGEGTVVKLDKAKKHIRVQFALGEKMFIFPDAFKTHLKIKD